VYSVPLETFAFVHSRRQHRRRPVSGHRRWRLPWSASLIRCREPTKKAARPQSWHADQDDQARSGGCPCGRPPAESDDWGIGRRRPVRGQSRPFLCIAALGARPKPMVSTGRPEQWCLRPDRTMVSTARPEPTVSAAPPAPTVSAAPPAPLAPVARADCIWRSTRPMASALGPAASVAGISKPPGLLPRGPRNFARTNNDRRTRSL
jgi:hypothetical protein